MRWIFCVSGEGENFFKDIYTNSARQNASTLYFHPRLHALMLENTERALERERGWDSNPGLSSSAAHWLIGSKKNLHAVLLLEFQVLLVEGVDTIDHGLDQLDLGVSQTMLVGNVVGVSSLAAGFAAGSTGLDGQLLAPRLQLVNALLGVSGQVDVDGSSHASAQVGGARVNVAELGGNLEVLAALGLDGVLDSLDASGEPLEDALDVTSLLHGDDAELILLVDPDQESFGGVVENATALGPVTLHASDLQVGVTGHEEEMVIDQLLAHLLVHASQAVVVASQVTSELGEGILHQVLDSDTLFLGDSGGQTESLDGAADTDSDGVDWDLGVDVSVDLADVHVRGVGEVGWETVVLADQRVEDIGEVDVGVLVTGVDAAVLVVEIDGASNGLGQGEAGSLGDNASELVPLLLGHVLCNQAVGGLDVGEFWCGHFCLFVCCLRDGLSCSTVGGRVPMPM